MDAMPRTAATVFEVGPLNAMALTCGVLAGVILRVALQRLMLTRHLRPQVWRLEWVAGVGWGALLAVPIIVSADPPADWGGASWVGGVGGYALACAGCVVVDRMWVLRNLHTWVVRNLVGHFVLAAGAGAVGLAGLILLWHSVHR